MLINNEETKYIKIARDCFLEFYKTMDMDTIKSILERGDFREIEAYIGAESAIRAGVEGLKLSLKKYDFKLDSEQYIKHIFYGDVISKDDFQNIIRLPLSVRAQIAVDVLTAVHEAWIQDNLPELYEKGRRDRKFKFMPAEAVGWQELKKNLLFMRPIFEDFAMNDEFWMKQVYMERRRQMLQKCNNCNKIIEVLSTEYNMNEAVREAVGADLNLAKLISKQIINAV